MAIYTRKGDAGESTLFNSSKKVSKGELIFSVVGNVDEANSQLGLVASQIDKDFPHAKILKNKIFQVQRNLFKLGAILAGVKMSIPASVVAKYEKEIDAWVKTMPKRKNFILPGGTPPAAEMFVARSIVRRLEREMVVLSETQKIKPNILVFVNRLSTYLYVLARYINFAAREKEIIWKK
jgi:cob(I)alamin adenosyltransferase